MLRVAVKKQRDGFLLDVVFDVSTPAVIALFGRSGCGKSTLVNIVAGLIAPDTGTIILDGETLLDTQRGVNVPAERRGIGYVFQDAKLFPHFDVTGNLLYGAKRARPTRTPVAFSAIVELLGLERLLKRRTHQLSGGECQRVALGRALLAQPRLLLLDEPLASLDVARRDEVLPYLESLRDRFGIPMVYVSHQFDEVLRLATHVVVLDQGSVKVSGTPAQVSLHPELRALVGEEAIGAVLDGTVLNTDEENGLAEIAVGKGILRVRARNAVIGTLMRVHLLARDIILATAIPQGLSVRNVLAGCITEINADNYDAEESDLILVDIGGATVLARITRAATAALNLAVGTQVWVLVKAVSTRGHTFARPT